jgi:hypothetical protein
MEDIKNLIDHAEVIADQSLSYMNVLLKDIKRKYPNVKQMNDLSLEIPPEANICDKDVDDYIKALKVFRQSRILINLINSI